MTLQITLESGRLGPFSTVFTDPDVYRVTGLDGAPGVLPKTVVGVGVVEPWVGELPGPPAPDLAPIRSQAWERIKAERDRRKWAGVKVGANWFHSDDSSRIQQIGLVMMGANIPPGLQWKTLTLTPPPVFVTMNQALAGQIFAAVAALDQAVFAAAEAHREAMEASPNPSGYDFSAGWPANIEDAP